ncbi:hypothetical protein PESP_a1497 [Pseudoalteromonas espejiana DSM 9414]|nr:hypothetical protein PESP_a1497 [Pseudoalteromonas espejiana DSM 9414]
MAKQHTHYCYFSIAVIMPEHCINYQWRVKTKTPAVFAGVFSYKLKVKLMRVLTLEYFV